MAARSSGDTAAARRAAAAGAIDLGHWAFATEQSEYRCDGIPFACAPPNACVRDLDTLRPYCCDYDGACWTYQATCSDAGGGGGGGGDDESADTRQCVNGHDDATWCCVNGRERCDQSKNYFCLSTAPNALRAIGGAALNETYRSLRAAAAAASEQEEEPLSFDPSALVASTTHAPSTIPTSAPAETPPSLVPAHTTAAGSMRGGSGGSNSPTPRPPADSSDSSGASTGAIAGAAVGAGIAVVLLALGFWFWFVRARRRRVGEKPTELPAGNGSRGDGGDVRHWSGAGSGVETAKREYYHTNGGPLGPSQPPSSRSMHSPAAGTNIYYHDRQPGSSLADLSELHGTDKSVGELPAVIPQEMPANYR